jgi:hypothetical protein
MLANPGISGNKIVEQLHIQKSSWPRLRAFLERQHYIACERNDKGHVVRMSVTEHGAEWLGQSRLKRHDHRFREPQRTGSDPMGDQFWQPVPGGGLYRPPEPVPRSSRSKINDRLAASRIFFPCQQHQYARGHGHARGV